MDDADVGALVDEFRHEFKVLNAALQGMRESLEAKVDGLGRRIDRLGQKVDGIATRR
jgi:hypothetical protein